MGYPSLLLTGRISTVSDDYSAVAGNSRSIIERPTGKTDASCCQQICNGIYAVYRCPAKRSTGIAVRPPNHNGAVRVCRRGNSVGAARKPYAAHRTVDPTEGLCIATTVGAGSDHNRSVGVYRCGDARASAWQEAKAAHGPIYPAEGLLRPNAVIAVAGEADDHCAVGVDAIGGANV